jgi:hypothetical protein
MKITPSTYCIHHGTHHCTMTHDGKESIWAKLSHQEIWDALTRAPKIAGPWEISERSGEMDVRRSVDGCIVATTLWVKLDYPRDTRYPAGDRTLADEALVKNGWLLV